MRKQLKEKLFDSLRHHQFFLSSGFSELAKRENPFLPFGIVFARNVAGEQFQFIAVTVSDDQDAFRTRIAWNTSARYPEEPRDLSLPLQSILNQASGEIMLAELGNYEGAWRYIDLAIAAHERKLAAWQKSAVEAQLAGQQMPAFPIGVVQKTNAALLLASVEDLVKAEVFAITEAIDGMKGGSPTRKPLKRPLNLNFD